MKKQFITLIACATIAGSIMPAHADNDAKRLSPQAIRFQATIKTLTDILAVPVVGLPVLALVYKCLPKTTVDFLPSEALDIVVRGGASIATGCLATIAASELCMSLYKLFGFSDAEIAAIRDASWDQKAWIFVQMVTIGGAVATVHAAQQEEKERKEREKRFRW